MTRPRRKHARNEGRGPAEPARGAWPGAAAIAVLGAWGLLYALAPPARDVFWAVNGLRSIAPAVAAAIVLAAIASAFVPLAERRARPLAIALGLAIVVTITGPLRQRFRLLGDSATRWDGIWNFARDVEPQPLRDWATVFHAQPFDLLTGLLAPAWVTRVTGSRELGVGLVSAVLAAVFMAGAWQLSRRLLAGRPGLTALWLAVVLWGGLEAFACYTESAGVLLAAGVWWWVAMLSPLRRARDVFALVFAWIAVLAAHRLGLVLLAPLLLRVLGPPYPEDDPRIRRAAWIGSALAGLAALAAQPLLAGGRLGSDLGELLRRPDADALATVPTDLLNLALLMAPLALLAALLGGRGPLRAALRDPRALVLLGAALPLLPTAFPMPVAASGLGLPRDWDLSALLGLTLTTCGALVLAHMPAPRRRVALVVALPLLVLGAGGWLAVNASEQAGERLAIALLTDRPRLGARHASGVELMLGDRAVELGRMDEAARLLESSWRHAPSPARGLHAARAWLYAGDPAAAMRMLAAVRSRGNMPRRRAMEADTLESYVRLRAARLGPGR